MKRKEKSSSASLRRKGIIKLGKVIFLCWFLFLISITNECINVNNSMGFVKEEGTISIGFDECFHQLVTQNEFAYLFGEKSVDQKSFSYFIDILNLSILENPIRMVRYDVTSYGYIGNMEISNNILYAISTSYNQTIGWCYSFFLLNITNPIAPWLIGEYREENVSTPWDFALCKNYAFLSCYDRLKIINSSNKSAPILVAEFSIPSHFIEVSENILYLLDEKIQAYNLTNPEQPILIGEFNDLEVNPMGMKVNENFVYVVYRWDGLQVINFNDHLNPTIADKYYFPKRDFDSGGIIEDIAFSSTNLFTTGPDLFSFDVKNPYLIHRKSRVEIEGRGMKLHVDEEIIFVTTLNDVQIFTYHEQTTKLIIGLSIGGGTFLITSMLIMFIVILRKQKKKRRN